MVAALRRWSGRHPVLYQALIWAIPALLVGAGLRLALLSYSPFAYWGSDSRSYFGFTDGVLTEFYFSINEKRRYLYPIFLLPVSMLPGSALQVLAWIQAGLGLLCILPMAYFVRKVFRCWQWWIVPVTVLYAGLPVFIWYEHELIADTILFGGFVWCLGGWVAWTSQKERARACRLFWWFLVPLALIALTKPSVKFLWPGILIALAVVVAWRVLRWPQWAALAAVFVGGATVGDPDQSAWLLYTTAFPLTQVESSSHAEYKAEIRDWVLEKRDRIAFYDEEDDEVHDFLREPEKQDQRPLWRDLAESDEKQLERMYKGLALEGIFARPDLFLMIGLQRLVGSANLSDFKMDRFEADYFARRFTDQLERGRNPESMIRIAFGLPTDQPLPSPETFSRWLAPDPDSAVARWMVGYSQAYANWGRLVVRPEESGTALAECRPTFLGWWYLAAILVSLIPPFLRPLGVWNIAVGGYLVAVYLVGIEHTRYFALAWPVILLSLPAVPDLAMKFIRPAPRPR